MSIYFAFSHTSQLFRWGLLALVLGAFIVQTAGCKMKTTYPPEDFFDGMQLEVAKAIDRNDIAAIERLASQGADLKKPGRREMDLLFYAAGFGDGQPKLEAVKTLVSLGVDPIAREINGSYTVLGAALKSRVPGNEEGLLQALIDGGMSPHLKTKHGTPLIVWAVQNGKLPHVKLLVEYGADINSVDSIGVTAFDASLSMEPEIGLYLLNLGANFNTAAVNGGTPAWSIYSDLQHMSPEPSPFRKKMENLRDMLIARGAKWPPDPPAVVREQMKAKGMKVAE